MLGSEERDQDWMMTHRKSRGGKEAAGIRVVVMWNLYPGSLNKSKITRATNFSSSQPYFSNASVRLKV